MGSSSLISSTMGGSSSIISSAITDSSITGGIFLFSSYNFSAILLMY
jgi:hypothetical protein